MSKSHPNFYFLLFKIMAGPSKKQKHLSDRELSKLLSNCESIDVSESEFSDDSDTSVDMSGSEERGNSDDKDSANDNSDMKHDTWARVGVERLCFPCSGKPGINVDSEDQNNPLEYLKLFITPEIAEQRSRETNWFAQRLLENKSDLKLKSRVHC
jgi:hypothetical protein